MREIIFKVKGKWFKAELCREDVVCMHVRGFKKLLELIAEETQTCENDMCS